MNTTATQPPPASEPVMVDVRWIAQTLACSQRHVTRLAEGGLMPSPSKLGRLSRWHRETILKWVAAGCPPVAAAKPG
ncbi:MAG: hypothetical protein FJ304_20255 [Planctomycetes bacterium]|nr:hypothetical protein [Planctomycetota bacterium]